MTELEADLPKWDLGKEQWDLIVAALKPGGLLIKVIVRVPPGHPSNQLVELFDSLRVLRYEDSLAVTDRRKGVPRSYSRVQLVA